MLPDYNDVRYSSNSKKEAVKLLKRELAVIDFDKIYKDNNARYENSRWNTYFHFDKLHRKDKYCKCKTCMWIDKISNKKLRSYLSKKQKIRVLLTLFTKNVKYIKQSLKITLSLFILLISTIVCLIPYGYVMSNKLNNIILNIKEK